MKQIIKNDEQRIIQNALFDFESGAPLSPVETQNYTIVQVAENYYAREFSIKEHRQICDLELTFSYMNGLTCAVNGAAAAVDKHGLYLAFRDEIHALESKRSARFQTLAVNFKEGPCLALLQAIKEKEQRIFYTPEIFGHLTEIITEFMRQDAPFLENNLDGLITSVLVKLTRSGIEDTFAEIATYDSKVSAMKNYIDTHFLQICSLEELSYVFGYTYSHISKVFKKTYGETPSEYLLSKKMSYARGLLQEGAGLEEIADVLGYSTACNFSRAFKKQTGESPKAYRLLLKKTAI